MHTSSRPKRAGPVCSACMWSQLADSILRGSRTICTTVQGRATLLVIARYCSSREALGKGQNERYIVAEDDKSKRCMHHGKSAGNWDNRESITLRVDGCSRVTRTKHLKRYRNPATTASTYPPSASVTVKFTDPKLEIPSTATFLANSCAKQSPFL